MALAAPSIDNAKVQHFSPCSKFSPPIWGGFQHQLTAFCRRACSRSAESMRASLCSRLIAVFGRFWRAVIHDARIRNFRPLKITFRRFWARWALLPKMCQDIQDSDNDIVTT